MAWRVRVVRTVDAIGDGQAGADAVVSTGFPALPFDQAQDDRRHGTPIILSLSKDGLSREHLKEHGHKPGG